MADINDKPQVNDHDHVETVPETILGTPADMVLSTLVAQDGVPWFRKPNLRKLYLLFIGSVLCIETTSGYDASVVNGLQAVPKWIECKLKFLGRCSKYPLILQISTAQKEQRWDLSVRCTLLV